MAIIGPSVMSRKRSEAGYLFVLRKRRSGGAGGRAAAFWAAAAFGSGGGFQGFGSP